MENRMDALEWPKASVCGQGFCPWPAYCLQCHNYAYGVQLEAMARFISFLTNTRMHILLEWVAMNQYRKVTRRNTRLRR